MGLDINIEAKSKKETYEWSFSGRSRWGDFVLYMENEFDYRYGEDMILTKPIINKMIGDLIYHSREIDVEDDEWKLQDCVRMIESLLYCYSIISNGGKATWEADW